MKAQVAASKKTTELVSREQLEASWNQVDVLTLPTSERNPYLVGFASSDRCIEEVLRLRYEVFNVELGEGLASSDVTGLDRDEFDPHMTHLVLLHRQNGRVVGTYRMQTVRHALAAAGIYSGREFDLAPLSALFDDATELGRACLSQDSREFSAVHTLWTGIRAFITMYDQRYLFGCASISSTDPADGWRAKKTIREMGRLHPTLCARATPTHSCGDPVSEFDAGLGPALRIPKLFRIYLRLGAWVVSEPALDAEFGTIDFLILLDGESVTFSKLNTRPR